MPWLFDTPKDVGDMDPNGPYTQAKIMRQVHDARRSQVQLELEYGNTVDDAWVAGIQPAEGSGLETSYSISDQEYVDLVTTHTSNDGELTYDAVKRGLYDHLNTEGVLSSGSIV